MNTTYATRSKKNKLAVVLAGTGLIVLLGAGCASHSHTYRETTTTSAAPATTTAAASETQTTTTTVHEETVAHEPEHYGIIGGTVHILGEILAFPFKVIAGLFEAIF